MSTSTPRAPKGLQRSGRSLWRSVVETYELTTAERLLLGECCRVADRLDALHEAHEGEAMTVTNFKGDEVAHPLLVEARQQGIVYARLIAALRLPDDAVDGETEAKRPQRRSTRGAYGVRAVPS